MLLDFHKTKPLSKKQMCEKCGFETGHLKMFEVSRPPPILTVKLKRFQKINQVWNKIDTKVEFPVDKLDIVKYVQDEDFLYENDIGTEYNLGSIITHSGSYTFGHYICYVRNPHNGAWFKYDDQLRVPIHESQIDMEQAYVLIYVRKDPSEAAEFLYEQCTHCKDVTSAMDALKAKLNFKGLDKSSETKRKQALERKLPVK